MIVLNVLDPKEWDVIVYGNRYQEGNTLPLRSIKSWQIMTHGDLVWNYAFFNFDNAANRKNQCAGRTLQYCFHPNLGVIGYDASTPAPTPTIMLSTGCRFRGWKMAVLNNIIQSSKLDKTTKRARNMNGLTADGRYIHVTTDRQTEAYVAGEVINRVKKLWGTTVQYLFIEDSGGSTQEYSALAKLMYAPEGLRDVATVISAKRKEPYTFHRQLQYGCVGDDVRVLQQILGGIEIDGSFGKGTLARVKTAQRSVGVKADGYAGPITMKALGQNFSTGAGTR